MGFQLFHSFDLHIQVREAGRVVEEGGYREGNEPLPGEEVQGAVEVIETTCISPNRPYPMEQIIISGVGKGYATVKSIMHDLLGGTCTVIADMEVDTQDFEKIIQGVLDYATQLEKSVLEQALGDQDDGVV